jgi:hypothetical protein
MGDPENGIGIPAGGDRISIGKIENSRYVVKKIFNLNRQSATAFPGPSGFQCQTAETVSRQTFLDL